MDTPQEPSSAPPPPPIEQPVTTSGSTSAPPKSKIILFILIAFAIVIAGGAYYLGKIIYRNVTCQNGLYVNGRCEEFGLIPPSQTIEPSLSPLPSAVPTASPKPPESSLCNCSFAISSSTNVEFLVTSPSGQQAGYLQASNSYVSNIPDASYGVEPGLSDDTGVEPPMPDEVVFGVSEAENGIYTLEVIGKEPGKYDLDVRIALGPGNGKVLSIKGELTKNQIDKYAITIPSGTIQKIGN